MGNNPGKRSGRRSTAPSPHVATTTTTASTSSSGATSIAQTPSSEGPVWEFRLAEKKWECYDRQTTRLLEGSYGAGMLSVVLNHGRFESNKGGHLVDFCEGVEIEQVTGKRVPIRRNPPLVLKEKKKERKLAKSIGFDEPEKDKLEEVAALTQWTEIASDHDGLQPDETCPICFCELFPSEEESEREVIVRLSECLGHYFHRGCIAHCYNGYLQCPICNKVYGVRVGAMPPGNMTVHTHPKGQSPLEGYSHCGTIQINYHFPNGVQGPEHPNPGVAYAGTSRTAYLPDDEDGREVLRLLQIGWERKLLFQVGRSRTTGSDNQVIWAGVHHKTSTSGGPTNFGYPDATYFERVKSELAAKGVV